MLTAIFTQRRVQTRTQISVKALVAAAVVALAVILPQLAHLAVGPQAGVLLLPMYLPVLLGGCLLGVKWGVAAALLSPIFSYLVTSAAGSAMPALSRLPFMMAELAVFALVCGLFSNKIMQHSGFAFLAVLLAQLCGRLTFLGLVAAFSAVTPLTPALVFGQIKTGLLGLALQAVLVPILVLLLKKALQTEPEK